MSFQPYRSFIADLGASATVLALLLLISGGLGITTGYRLLTVTSRSAPSPAQRARAVSFSSIAAAVLPRNAQPHAA